MKDKNTYSYLMDKNSASDEIKNTTSDKEMTIIKTLIPESLKVPIQYIENNNFEKFNSYITSTKLHKSTLNSLLCFCLQNYAKNRNLLDQIKLLIYKGADTDIIFKNVYDLSYNNSPKIEDNNNISLLMYACLYNDKKLVEMIVSKTNINYLDNKGKNALFYLFSKTNNIQKVDFETANIIRLLVKYGINVNCEAKFENGNKIIKQSPLSIAAYNNYFISFKELLNNDANLNFISEPEGDSILHIAVKKINHEMIKLILKANNLNLEIKNKEGKTARDLALEIEPDSIIYNLIVEKISESDNIERKKSDDLSFEEKSKRSYEQNDTNNIYISENIATNGNIRDHTQIKSMLKKFNHKKKNLLNKYIKEMKTNTTNIKLHVNISKEIKRKNNIGDNIDKIMDYIVLKNDENKNPIINIDLLSKKFLDYKRTFNNSNTSNNSIKNKKKNYINKITFMNNNIDNNINININNDLSSKNNQAKLEKENSSIKKDLEVITKKKNELINTLQEKNNIINKLEQKHDKEIELLNSNLKKIKEEKESMLEKVKLLENEKINLDEKITKLENEKLELKKNITKMQKEYDDLNQKYEKILKEKENLNIQNHDIRNNPSLYSNFLNKKFNKFNYEKEFVLEQLKFDLIDFQTYVTNRIEKEQNIYDTLLKNVQILVDKTIPNYVVNLYGSHATNLCLPWSDLDLVLIPKINKFENGNNIRINSEKDNLALLSILFENIRNESWVKDSKFLSKASVPIIKLISIEQYNSISIDISIQDEKHFGIKCVELVKSFIEEYKSLKPIVLAYKNILKIANLNDPYKGGISSYGLILMIVFFLQKQKSSGIDISPGENNANLGKLFYEFIRFYSLNFDNSKEIININEGNNTKTFNEFDFHNMVHSSDLVIIDPLNKFNNVAKSCLQFYNIKLSFIICLITLQDDCECGCHFNKSGEKYDNQKEEYCFLKRMFNSVRRFG